MKIARYAFATLIVAGFSVGSVAWAKGPPQSALDRKACNALWVSDRKAHPGKPKLNHNQFMYECIYLLQRGR
jgi:hypothetical protein